MERVLEPEIMDTAEDAESYDAMDHSGPNDAFVQRLLELGVRGEVLDVGCGPGHIALLLAAMHPDVRVTGVDLSDHMLRIAEEHREVSSHAERVRFAKADAKTTLPTDKVPVNIKNIKLSHEACHNLCG